MHSKQNHKPGVLSKKPILLVGLPGSGKTRVAHSLNEQFGYDVLSKPDLLAGKNGVCEYAVLSEGFDSIPLDVQIWCVIDVRSSFEHEPDTLKAALQNMLSIADVVVMSFVENASLQEQSWWNRWLKEQAEKLKRKPFKVLRWFYQQFSNEIQSIESSFTVLDGNRSIKPFDVEEYSFEVGKVMLDHLLMGLDNSRRNLGMKIWRVKAVLQTFEYENLITLEGTPNRFDTFSSERFSEAGKISIQGIKLDEQWLQQLVDASRIQ